MNAVIGVTGESECRLCAYCKHYPSASESPHVVDILVLFAGITMSGTITAD